MQEAVIGASRTPNEIVVILWLRLYIRGTPVPLDHGDAPLYLRIAALALRRPRTLPHILRASWAFRARLWYRRFPFLPVPPRSYLRWRMETAYGDPEMVPSLNELERFLVWTSSMRRLMTRRVDD